MWKNKFFVIFIIVSLSCIVITSPPVQIAKWMILEFLAPHIYSDIKVDWQKKPTAFLLWKLVMNYNYIQADVAAEILSERKEKMAVPILVMGLKSPLEMVRRRAILTLGDIGDKRAIKPLISIIKRGSKNGEYFSALGSLAKLKYEPIIPILMQMLNEEKNDRAEAVRILGYFKKAELLPLFEKIAAEDPENYIRNRAKKAMASIREKAIINEK